MSQYSDRIDRIKAGRDKTYNSVGDNPNLYKSLPRMHRDLYWLLDIVLAYDDAVKDEMDVHEQVAKSKMDSIMGARDEI